MYGGVVLWQNYSNTHDTLADQGKMSRERGCRKICLYHDENSVQTNEALSGQYNLVNVCWTVCHINLKAGEHFIRESNILIFIIWHSLGKRIGANI